MSQAWTPSADDLGAPLAGRSVIVTRARAQAAALAEPLEALGAEVLCFPVIATVDPEDWDSADRAIARLGDYDWVVFTSTNGVDRFLERFRVRGGSRDVLAGAQIAAVGAATAARIRRQGLEPALVPADFRAEGLIEEFQRRVAAVGAGVDLRWRVLIPRALQAREILPEALRGLGCEVDVVPVYRTILPEPDPTVLERLRAGTVDAVTFTSGSTVRNFLQLLEAAGLEAARALHGVILASIGPVTTDVLRELGYDADVEALEPTTTSLAAALGNAMTPGRG